MTKQTFQQFVKDLTNYYGLERIVDGNRFDQWYFRIKDIPEGAMNFINKHIQDERDTMPRNLPRAMFSAYQSWRALNSDKMINYERTACNECGGRGFLWVWAKTEAGSRYQAVYRCGRCENWRRDVHPEAVPPTTKQQVAAEGLEMVADA